MTMTDAVILIFLAICLIRGVFRGAVKELFSIVGVLFGLVAVAFSYARLSATLPGWAGAVPWGYLTCFLILFVAVYLLMAVSGTVIAYLLQLRWPGWIDRFLGAGFGTVKGVLVVSVLLMPLVAFLPRLSTRVAGSALLPYETRLAEKMASIVPATIHDLFSSHIAGYKQAWMHRREPAQGD